MGLVILVQVMYNNYVNVDTEDPMNPILSKVNCKIQRFRYTEGSA